MRLGECTCTDFVDYEGFGECKQIYYPDDFDEYGPICYVTMPSTCSDLNILNGSTPVSWEACEGTKTDITKNGVKPIHAVYLSYVTTKCSNKFAH